MVTDEEGVKLGTTRSCSIAILALGIGCERGVGLEVAALARDTLAAAGLAAGAVAAVVSVNLKTDEPAIHDLASAFGVPARFFPASRLLEETERLTIRSEAAFRATGCWGVAEGAALAAAGPGRRARRPASPVAARHLRDRARRRAVRRRRDRPAARPAGDRRGRSRRSGLADPGGERAARGGRRDHRLPAFLDLLGDEIAGKRRHDSAIGEEAARARLALDLAAEGRSVALVWSGDTGVYGLATWCSS